MRMTNGSCVPEIDSEEILEQEEFIWRVVWTWVSLAKLMLSSSHLHNQFSICRCIYLFQHRMRDDELIFFQEYFE